MAYIFLAIVLTGVFSQFYKFAHRKNCDVGGVNLGCYLGALAAVAIYLRLVEGFHMNWSLVGIGIFGGASLCGAIVTFFLATKTGKLSVCWTVVGLSCAIPVIVSFVVWKEALTFRKVAGLVLAAGAIVLLGLDHRQSEKE